MRNAVAECFPSAEVTPQPVSGAIPGYYTSFPSVLKLLQYAVLIVWIMANAPKLPGIGAAVAPSTDRALRPWRKSTGSNSDLYPDRISAKATVAGSDKIFNFPFKGFANMS